MKSKLRDRIESRHSRTGRRRAGTPLRGLTPLVAGLMLWQWLGSSDSFSFPRPSSWFEALHRSASNGELWPAVQRTFETFALSLVLASIVGLAIGLIIGGSHRLDRALAPTLDFLRSVPPPVFVPIGALLFGATLLSGVLIVTLAIVWPILLNTASARRHISPVRLDASRVLGLSGPARLAKIVVPSVVPGAFLGIKLAISYSLIATLLVDIIGSGSGIGRLLMVAQSSFDSRLVWGLLLLLGLFGYLLNSALVLLEDRLLRNWGN